MSIKPLKHRLLVRRLKQATNHNSPIILPDIINDDDNTGGVKLYLVLDVGSGTDKRPMEAQAGDRVLCKFDHSGPYQVDDERWLISDDLILAILPKQQI